MWQAPPLDRFGAGMVLPAPAEAELNQRSMGDRGGGGHPGRPGAGGATSRR